MHDTALFTNMTTVMMVPAGAAAKAVEGKTEQKEEDTDSSSSSSSDGVRPRRVNDRGAMETKLGTVVGCSRTQRRHFCIFRQVWW